ncbi:hypothetical protein ACP4OV_015998 [Aristida adscensionis]
MEPSPVSATYGVVRSLPAKLGRLVSPEASHGVQLSKGEKRKIRLLRDTLQQVISDYLMDPWEVEFPASAARCWVEEVRELSYDVDDFHDELLDCLAFQAGNDPRRCGKLASLREGLGRRRWVAGEVSRFTARLEQAIQRHTSYNLRESQKRRQGDDITTPSSSSAGLWCPPPPLHGVAQQAAARPAGVAGDAKIEEWLTDEGERRLRVVAVVGPGGVGKTTLARELYCKLGGRFECRAFVRSPQLPDTNKLLTSILLQVRPHRPPSVSESSDLSNTIKTHLQHKKYFIIIDELWALSTWDIIHPAFPDDNCQSRILTITEVDAVAHRCGGHRSKNMHIFRMEPLSKERQHELFFSRFVAKQSEYSEIFGEDASEIRYFKKEISSEIISRCGGFPLAIIAIASLLAREPPNSIEQWNYIWSSLSSSFGTNATKEGMAEVLSLCYNNLPDHLKTCMLYMSLYQEDDLIWKDDLVRQWITEGFICAKNSESMVEVASSYFHELLSRGMIQPVDINDIGEVLSCTVHYMILHLLRYKSIEENFITAIDHSETNIRLAYKVRRLSLHFGDAADAEAPTELRLSQVRSLAFFGPFQCLPPIAEFRLLRVLILHLWADQDNISVDLATPCSWFRLRHLEMACNVTLKLQTQQRGLQYLETLKIDSRVSEVPQDIVRLPSLLYLSLPGDIKLPNGIGNMASLQALGCFDLSSNSAVNVESLDKLTNLQDLRLTCSKVLCDRLVKNMGLFASVLPKLIKLRSLTMSSVMGSPNANTVEASGSSSNISSDCLSSVSSPPTLLQKLEFLPRTLFFSVLPEWIKQLDQLNILKVEVKELSRDHIDMLKGLPALTALTLYVRAAPDERINFYTKEFSVLKYFKFICSTFCLSFKVGAMSNVQRLKLGFNADRVDQCSLVDAGFENLTGLGVFSAKIGGAGADESCRKALQSALEDAFTKHVNRPIINVQSTQKIFYGYEETSTAAPTIHHRTSETPDVITEGGPDEPNVQADDRTMSSQSYSHMQNPVFPLENLGICLTRSSYQGEYKITRTHKEKYSGEIVEADSDQPSGTQDQVSGNDTSGQADSRTSIVSQSSSHIQNPGTRTPELKYSVVEADSDQPYRTQDEDLGKYMREQADSRTSVVFESTSLIQNQEWMSWRPIGIFLARRMRARMNRYRVDSNDLEYMMREMDMMVAILVDSWSVNTQWTLPADWILQLQDLVCDIEDFLDMYNWLLQVRSWRSAFSLSRMSRIEDLKIRAESLGLQLGEHIQHVIYSKTKYEPETAPVPSAGSPLSYPDDKPVGIEQPKRELLDMVLLEEGPAEALRVISIVGRPGVGKTTLARELYAEPHVCESFRCAWVMASELSNAVDLLKNITQQVDIRRNKRFLVVIDGLKRAEMWNDIAKAFHGCPTGSRIIVTTSIQSVAAACSPERYIYRMQVLSSDNSRKLFWRKFSTENRKLDLDDALEEVLRKCDGLPLALISAARYLGGQGQNLTSTYVRSLALGTGEEMKRSLMHYYDSMSEQTCLCLLSLSIFPSGHLINRKSLIRRWIADGLVVGDDLFIVNRDAGNVFDELVDRNIIEPVLIGNNSMVKRCRVPPLILEFIVSKSVSKNLVTLIREDEPLLNRKVGLPVHRLSVQGGTEKTQRVAAEIGFNHARSLTICNSCPFGFLGCRLLRVLDVEGCTWIDNRVLQGICKSMMLLKYLSLRGTPVSTIPKGIKDLYDLETLDIRETKVERLPVQVLMLPRLAHLFGKFKLPRELRNQKRSKLQRFFSEKSRLQTLSGFVMAEKNGYEPIVLQMRRLRKVKIWCKGYITGVAKDLFVDSLKSRMSENNAALESLSIDLGHGGMSSGFLDVIDEGKALSKLSSIKLRGRLLRVPSFIQSAGSNLSELELTSTGLRLEELSVLQRLPQLLYLKLAEDGDGFAGDSFDVESRGFPSLVRLCFEAPKLPGLRIREGGMRCLTSLHLLCPKPPPSHVFWEIEHLKNLKEVVLHSSTRDEDWDLWLQKGRRVRVTKQLIA